MAKIDCVRYYMDDNGKSRCMVCALICDDGYCTGYQPKVPNNQKNTLYGEIVQDLKDREINVFNYPDRRDLMAAIDSYAAEKAEIITHSRNLTNWEKNKE